MVDGRPHAIGIRQKTLQTSLLSKNYIFNLENDLLEQKFFFAAAISMAASCSKVCLRCSMK